MIAYGEAEGPLFLDARLGQEEGGGAYVEGIVTTGFKVSHQGRRHDHRCMFRSYRSEDVASVLSLAKGSTVRITGKLSARAYTDSDGRVWCHPCLIVDPRFGKVEVVV